MNTEPWKVRTIRLVTIGLLVAQLLIVLGLFFYRQQLRLLGIALVPWLINIGFVYWQWQRGDDKAKRQVINEIKLGLEIVLAMAVIAAFYFLSDVALIISLQLLAEVGVLMWVVVYHLSKHDLFKAINYLIIGNTCLTAIMFLY